MNISQDEIMKRYPTSQYEVTSISKAHTFYINQLATWYFNVDVLSLSIEERQVHFDTANYLYGDNIMFNLDYQPLTYKQD